VGILGGEARLDLDYAEDSQADVDMNLVMTGKGRFVEIQGTAEKTAFTEEQLAEMLSVGIAGIHQLVEIQKRALLPRTSLNRLVPTS
jgi:ribonuclease PH